MLVYLLDMHIIVMLLIYLQAFILYGTMTGSSKMFASTLTKCLDQIFQTTMLPLNEDSLNLMQNLGKSYLVYASSSHTQYSYFTF